HDTRNFLECVSRLISAARVREDEPLSAVEIGAHRLWVGTFPIGIDFSDFASRAAQPRALERIRDLRASACRGMLLLGVERLDYTKGLVERLAAFERLLELHPELCQAVTLLQIVVPSRENVPAYMELKSEVDRAIGRINGRFATPRWQPIHYVYGSVDKDE